MPISHLLLDFGGSGSATQPLSILGESAFEEQKLESFEQGYTAGWDDSLKMQSEEQDRVTGTLARNLEDLSFTYQEAYTQMLNSVTPIFGAMVDRVLPEVMKDTVGHIIVEQLQDIVGNQTNQPITLSVPQGYSTAVQSIMPEIGGMSVTVSEDINLIDGQVYLKIGGVEREVDTTGMMNDIRTAVHGFSHDVEMEMVNG